MKSLSIFHTIPRGTRQAEVALLFVSFQKQLEYIPSEPLDRAQKERRGFFIMAVARKFQAGGYYSRHNPESRLLCQELLNTFCARKLCGGSTEEFR